MIHSHILLIRGTFPLSTTNFVTVIRHRFSNAGELVEKLPVGGWWRPHNYMSQKKSRPSNHSSATGVPSSPTHVGNYRAETVVSDNKTDLKAFLVFDCSTGAALFNSLDVDGSLGDKCWLVPRLLCNFSK